MNEEALNEAYAVFKSGGYTDSIEDFKVLIATNTEALNEAYSVFKSGGYTDSIEDFKTLLGVTAPSKKKVPSEPVGMLRDTMVSTSRPIQAKDTLSELQFDETKYSEPDVTIPLKREEPKKDLFGGTLLADSYVDEFEKSQKGITGKLIEDQEEYTVPKLNYEYGQYGFTFQESTVGADAMTVTADNGKAIEVNLDPWFGIGAESEAEALKKFLKENKSTSAISKTSKKIQNEKEILNTVKIFNAETQQFQLEVNKLISTKKELDDVYSNKFANISAADIKNNPTLKAEYDEWSRNQNALKNNVSKLKNKEELFKTKGAELDTVVGEYAIMKSQQGTWAGAVFNALIEGVKGVGVSSGNTVTDVLTEFSDNAGLPVEYFQSEIIRIAREDNIVPKEYQEPGKLESLSRDELVKALGGDTNDLAWMSNSFGKGLLMLTPMSMQSIAAIKGPFYEETPFDKARAKVLDLSRKSLKYYDSDERGTAYEKAVSGKMIQPYSYQAATVDTDKSMIERTADFYDDYLKNQSTTKQYSDMKKENFWGGALLGLAESLPAMIGPGFAARTAEMYLQVTNHVDEEMKNDPTFDNITESEKYYVKAPIGIATAVLESLGFRNVIAQKGLLNGFVSRALNKSTASTTAKTFGEFIKQDVKSSIGRGALTILGGGLAEFETGFFQEIAESGVKEIYNQSKGKDMFQTPDAWYEWVGDAIYAGGQEMVGGFVMGAPGAVMSAVRKQEISALPNGTFEMFEGMMSDPNYKTMYQTKLKQQINSGEITVEEAKAKEQEYDTLAGLASKIPTDYSTDQKKRALELLYKRSAIDAQIEGKDPKLVVKIQAEKDEVNRQLENILNESNNESTLDKEEEDKIPEFDQEKIELEKESKTLLDKKIEYLVSIKESLLGQGKTEEESNSIAENQWLETKEGKRYTEIQSQLQEKSKVDSKKDSDTGVTEEEKSDIDAFFDATSDNSTTKLNPNLSINRKNANISPAKKKMRDAVVKIAKISSRSISKIFPEVRIILHDSNEEYLKYATQGAGRAEFNPTQNAIHVNLSSAKRSTMPHEIFHAILINTVKTDENAAKIAEMMVSSVRKTLDSNSELAIKIDRFAGLYTGELAKFKNEEKIAELIGLLSSNEFGYRTLSKPSKNAVINFFKDVARMLGINLGPSFGKTDESVIDLINTISQKTATGEEITEEDLKPLEKISEEGGSINIGNPTEIIRQSKTYPENKFTNKPLNLSFVTEADKIDIKALINEIIDKKQKVWFWMADQFGRGDYYDIQIDDTHYLDAGPSFALDPENKNEGVLWASGLDEKTLKGKISQSDYIFFISGSAQKAKLFNKRLIDLVGRRVENKNESFESFKKALKEFNVKTKDLEAINDALNEYSDKNKKTIKVNSFEDLANSPKRKPFLIALDNINSLKTTKKGSLKELLNKFDVFFELDEFRDGFYKANDFNQNDIMLVGKPNSVGGKSKHSTYEWNIMGEVIGVPDVKIDAWEIMPQSIKDEYAKGNKFIDSKTGKEKTRGGLNTPQKTKVIAAETGVVRDLTIYLQENETGKIQPERTRDGRGRDTSRSIETLEGAPIVQGATGPDVNLVNVAEKYAADNGIDLKRQSEYVKVDEERAKRMAAAYEEMANEPQDPKVKEAYAELIKQTKSQYEALIDAGYEFSFFDGDTDPYAGNPSNAMRDLRKNKNMAVYGTYAGYGTDGITDSEIKNNPMLADTGLRWKDNATGKKHMVTANDLFRAVHDAFGHGLEGSGFRARGEENAWQAHVRLFTGTAIAAITTETRGQNSWLNYGPYGEKNRTAKVNDTIFAEPKIGLLPSWTWNEGRAGDAVVRQQKIEVRPEIKPKIDERYGIRLGGIAYVPVDVMMNFLDVRGKRKETYESKDSRDRIEAFKKSIIKNGWDNRQGGIYLDVDAFGNAWIAEGNHRVIAAQELGMKEIPVEVKFDTARANPNTLKFDKSYAANPTSIISKERIDAIRKKVEPGYHIGYISIWETNLVDNKTSDVRQQKDLNEIIADFKDNNFREEVIRDKLIRIDRFSVKKVDEALSSSMDVPVSFKNIKDGSKAGEALFKRIDNFRKLLVQKNDKSTKLKPAELKSKIIEYARKQRVTYKTTDEISETVKLFKDKLIAKNNKSKKPITTTELNKKVKAFREQEFANRDALRETAKRKIEKYEAKETDKNNKLNGILTQQEIIDKTIEFLEKQPEYIAESDTYTVGSSKKGTKTTVTKKGLSTQQAKMLSDLQNTVGIRPSQDLSSKIRMARIMIAQRKKGNMDLNAIKRELRNFIRKTLPPYLYTKTDVTKMVNLIALADSSTIDNIYNQVTEFVIQKNVKSLSEDINSILNGKYEETQSGRLKGIKIDVKTKERIKLIKNLLLSNKSTDLEILDANEKINIRLNELESEPNQTQKIITEIEDLKIIIQYNNSLLMSDTDINKVSELDEVNNALSDIIEFGKSTLAAELEAAHKEYIRQFEYVYEDIVGKAINMQDDDAEKQLKDYKADREMEAQRKKVQNRVQFLMGNISNFISTKVFSTHESLDGLMDKISSLPGEMFGGRTQEIITEKIDEATRMFKKRMMIVEMVVRAKLEDLYGKDWAKSQRENRKASFTGIYRNKQAVDKAKANYNSNPTPDNAKALENAIAKNELSISQNQMYYMYNQFKDPSNHGSFKNKYGDDYARVMKEIEEKLDPKLKEFADWQVDELFPELYEYYNDVYKRIYRTNMPWNKFYAGMLYKEGGLVEPLDLLSNNSIRNTSVGASSTKSRTENDLSIAEIDGTDALTTYLRDMEYFAAYAETIRDVNKLFTNNYIKSAIIDIHGKATMQLITDSIQKIANKGTRTGLTDWAVNSLNNVFVLSRLALSPVIMLKQLTSTFTYASDIGWANWLKYNFKNAPEMSKIWKEIRDNSVYMQDRKYDSILKAIESYTDSGMKEFVPNPTKIFVLDFMMWFTKFGDRTAIMLGGMPNYSFYKDQALKSGKTEAEAIEIAIRKFEKDTKRTQQSSDLQDKDTLQTSNPFYRASNMFMTTPRQYLRKEIQAVRALSKKVSQWDKNAGKGSVNENLRVLLMYHVYMPLLFQYVSAGLPGLLADWDEEDEKDLLRASIIGNLNALFILGEAVTMAGDLFTGKPWAGEGTKSLGILNYATSISKKAKTALKTTDPIKRAENWNKFYIEASTITGAPTPTLKKFFDNYSDLGSSGSLEKDILKAFNYSDYVISGPKKTKTTSNKIKSIYQMNAEYEKKMNSYEKQKQKDSRKIDESLIPNYRK
jgi:hypothetical protein